MLIDSHNIIHVAQTAQKGFDPIPSDMEDSDREDSDDRDPHLYAVVTQVHITFIWAVDPSECVARLPNQQPQLMPEMWMLVYRLPPQTPHRKDLFCNYIPKVDGAILIGYAGATNYPLAEVYTRPRRYDITSKLWYPYGDGDTPIIHFKVVKTADDVVTVVPYDDLSNQVG